MRLMICSDIHGSALYCAQMLQNFEREKCDRLLLLGDILYHGPRNALPDGYDPKATSELLNERKEKIFCIRGNCDAEVDQMVLNFPIMADYAVFPVENRMLYATHGHVYNGQNLPPLCAGDILLFGHIHVPKCETQGKITVLNPGSVSIPKEGSARGYMTLENGLFEWKTLDYAEPFMRWQA